MISTVRRGRYGAGRIARGVLAVTLLAAVTGAASVPAMAKDAPAAAPKIVLSAKFQPAYVAFTKAMDAAKASPAVTAAAAKLKAAQDGNDDAATKAAIAELGATLADPKAKLDAAFAAATTADDKYVAGQLAATQLGAFASDPAIQLRGINAMIDSGKASADQLPQLNFFKGEFAYQQSDYPTAIAALKVATAGGYHQNNADVILAESLLDNKQIAEGLAAWKTVLTQAQTAGQPAQEGFYGHALQIAYDNQLKEQTLDFGRLMVSAYPSQRNWNSTIGTTIAELEFKNPGEELDLLRLLGKAGKITQKGHLSEYIRVADPCALPNEVKSVIDQAVANGVITVTDPSVSPSYQLANQRLPGERAALPGYKKDLTSASANAAALASDGDSYLAFGQYADAAAFYQAALGKAGVDADAVNTRLGIAQVGSGDFAGAQASFAKVTGASRGPIAQLWGIYAQQKAAGK